MTSLAEPLPQPPAQFRSDQNGEVVIRDAPIGPYQIVVQHLDHRAACLHFEGREKQPLSIELRAGEDPYTEGPYVPPACR